MRKIIKSNNIYGEETISNGYIIIEEGRISGIEQSIAQDEQVVDFSNARIIPGVFDTHNHGTYGYLLKDTVGDVAKEEVRKYLKALAAQGVTAVFPTCYSNDSFPATTIAMISTFSEVAKEEPVGATILGIHSEGPWLNRTGEKGIKAGYPPVVLETAKKMVNDGKGLLKLVAASPEISGITEILDFFLSEGITLAYAHSDLLYEEARKALNSRFSVVTHLGNVMSGIHHRDIGSLGACLLNEGVQYEIICDGHHISLPMLDLYFRILDYDRFMLVSDCTGVSGAPAGRYKGWNPGMSINVDANGFVLNDEGSICGSSKPVLFGMKNLVEIMGIPLETVIKMSSLNPCKTYGFAERKGSIKVGKDADLVIIDDGYQVIQTYVKGRLAFDRDIDTDLFNKGALEERS